MGKIDYPELEKQKVKVNWGNGKIKTGIVAGCNYDIGITIVNKYDSNDFLLCLNGICRKGQTRTLHYKPVFYALISQIKKGQVKIDMVYKIIGILEPSLVALAKQKPTQDHCAFGQ